MEDSTGVISLSAWGEQADALAAITNQIDQTTSHASGETLYLRVELFSIGQLGGSPVQLCPIGAIQTLAKQRNSVGSVDDDTVDATRGTQFQIVKTIDVRTPSVTSVLTVHNSVHGVASLETNWIIAPALSRHYYWCCSGGEQRAAHSGWQREAHADSPHFR